MANETNLLNALDALKNGKCIILLDEEDRENEGDIVFAAQFTTPELINFTAREARGLICLAMDETLIHRFDWPLMGPRTNPRECAFTISIDAAKDVTTGISAQDRATTILRTINPSSTSKDFVSPGHIFPLQARKGGVLARRGHTEGSVDLMTLAGLSPAAVICEVMNADGTMARKKDLIAFSKRHDIPLLHMQDIVDYRLAHECLVEEAASTRIPIPPYGEFTLKVFTNRLDQTQHVALIKEPFSADDFVLARVHSECFTGDLFGSARCDCGWQLDHALEKIGQEGGVLLYLKQEGRGIGLINKLKAYNLQDQGLDTVDANLHLGFGADQRDYWIGAQILRYLGLKKIKLLTNNPQKVTDLEHAHFMVERIPLLTEANPHNKDYLKTKREKLKHWM